MTELLPSPHSPSIAIVTGGWVLGLRMNRESPRAMGVKSSESTSPGLRGASVTVQSATDNSAGGGGGGVTPPAKKITISKKANRPEPNSGEGWVRRGGCRTT